MTHTTTHRQQIRAWTLALSICLCACSGNIDAISDAARSVDQSVAVRDTAATVDQQVSLPADRGAADAGITVGDGRASLGPCDNWSNWTCRTNNAPFLCSASCGTGAQTVDMNCLSTGHCACGIGVGACGPYPTSDACGTCRRALENGCCSPP